MNPAIGLFKAVAEAGRRFPVKKHLNECIVAVAAIHAFGRRKIVTALKFYANDLFKDIDQMIDRDQINADTI